MQALLAEVIHVGDAQTTTQGLICTVLVAQLGRLALAGLEFDRDQLVVEHIRTVKNDAERALADLLAYAVVHANNALVQLARHRLISMVEGVRKRRIEFVVWEGVMMMVLRAGAGRQHAGPAGWVVVPTAAGREPAAGYGQTREKIWPYNVFPYPI